MPTHLVHSQHPSGEALSLDITNTVQAAGEIPDEIRTKLETALGKGLESLPELDFSKIKLVDEVLMVVDSAYMTHPIMRGVRRPRTAPYDNREYLVVKVEDIQSHEISTQVFHRMYLDQDAWRRPWTTAAGPIVTTSCQELSTKDLELLGHLFHGFAVSGRDGHTFRLAC